MKYYCEIYDAYYEGNTGEFLGKKCKDKKCPFCAERPKLHPEDCKCEKEEAE